jgi:HAD superfamily hydrolase (TIGR01509 family)
MSRIQAIVFDCFGVLTSDGWLPFKKKHFGGNKSLEEQATDLNKQVDSGLADYNDFLGKVAELAHIGREAARRAIESNVPDDELFDYIRAELKPYYKIGLLSNAGGNWLAELFKPEQVALFDAAALSYETGHVKPHEQAYATIAERLGVAVEECVLIDDQERYCTAAREVGMQAVWYRDFEQMKRDLEKILSNTKD